MPRQNRANSAEELTAPRMNSGQDVVMTPQVICDDIVDHFKPNGLLLEPCRGSGNFQRAMERYGKTLWCEISEGQDFYAFNEKVDWIITNPPWSDIRGFLRHSMQVPAIIVFLVSVHHTFTRARLRDLREFGFGIKEIRYYDVPLPFTQSGFQTGAIYWKRGWLGPCD